MNGESDPTFNHLPWGACRERTCFPESVYINPNVKPGEYVLQTLFAEFTVLAEKKIEHVLEEKDNKKTISQSLQRGLDPNFDQLLTALGTVSEQALPSVLKTLFSWYERQYLRDGSQDGKQKLKLRDKDLAEKRNLSVDFIYCLVLIEVLKQLPYHPGQDDLVGHIINQAFAHFRYKEGSQSSTNASSLNTVADLHAEVIGVLAQSRFLAVKKRFMSELKELKSKDQSPFTIHSIISLLMGMKFFRVKMVPIEEFESSIVFLQECGIYFLEVKDKDIKHALAGMFVEILLPVAAVVKNEVNVPVLKNFVESLYTSTLDMSTRRKHCLALYPMVTCLLCVSQKQFFLSNWPTFLGMCLSQLKNKDSKMARVALESLYRLVWVYVIRIKCESNTATISRLQSIVNSLFPKGSKVVMPKDMPLNIFIKIIQFVAQERLDFAMREIIFDLLCVGKPVKVITPERMSIGLRAFLVIADGLQQREGDPPMPQTVAVMPSGNTIRHKKIFLNKMLSEEAAKMIGVVSYYTHVRKAFDAILKLLDSQVGKALMLTKTENVNKEPEEMISGERKPKIDLLRICVAAIPRLLPDGMNRYELIDLLSRLTVHMDEELGKMAFQSLQKLMEDHVEWRQDILRGYVMFIEREVTDPYPQLLEQAVRRLIQLLTQWKTLAAQAQAQSAKLGDKEKQKSNETLDESIDSPSSLSQALEKSPHAAILHKVEGFGLVMFCSNRPIIRKLAVVVLKDIRHLFNLLGVARDDEPCVLDVVDKACPLVVEKVINHLPPIEKTAVLSASPVDFQWLADRTSIIWSAGYHDAFNDSLTGKPYDPWVTCITSFMHYNYVTGQCHTALASAWPLLYSRLTALTSLVDLVNIRSDNRSTSILGSNRRGAADKDFPMTLWQNYVTMGCTIAPPSVLNGRHGSIGEVQNNSPDSLGSDKDSRSLSISMNSTYTARDLFKLVVPLIRAEAPEVRETAITGLGNLHPSSFRDIVDELVPFIKDAIDRKQETMKRRKKRDILRVALARIFHYMAQNGTFAQSPSDVTQPDSNALCNAFVEYIDGARLYLENESEKENPVLHEIRLHFSAFIRHLVRNVPVENRKELLSPDLREKLFKMFGSWSGKFGKLFGATGNRPNRDERCTELEISAVQAMSAVLCCGPVWDPHGLSEDSFIYQWLDTLLGSHDEKIYKLAQETVVLLLDYNSESQALLDWVIDRCYTGTHEVADGCFNALALVFNNREYPCDHVAMLIVTLLNTGCPRVAIQETAVHLFHLLYKRFFLDDVIVSHEQHDQDNDGVLKHDPQRRKKKDLQDLLISGPYARSLMFLSESLAVLHPELTIPVYSELTHRFQTAIPPVRQLLLQFLLPWLHNMELVDPNLSTTSPLNSFLFKYPDLQSDYSDYAQPPLKGEGWGLPQATEMVLNNLFYITAKFGDEHAKEIELLWAALVSCWPGNLRVIMRYVIVVTGMAPNMLLSCAKRVILYLGRAKPERMVDEIMGELQTVETLNFQVERTQTPPFFRLTLVHKRSGGGAVEENEDAEEVLVLDKGQIHTKRRSGEDPTRTAECTPRTNSTTSLRSESSASSAPPGVKYYEDEETLPLVGRAPSEPRRNESPIPFPLPMPAYGGYFAPLSDFLPESNLPTPPYQRCNLAVMLLSDLIVDGIGIDWTVHLPLMLHIIFLGLDHSRPLIHEHCKRLLLNLLLTLAAHNDHFEVARILLSNKTINDDFALTVPHCVAKGHALADGMEGFGVTQSMFSINSSAVVTSDSVSSLVDVESLETTEQDAKAVMEFLATRRRRPLWSYEDITAKVWNIKSADQLEHFLKHVLRVFKESVPLAHIEQRWAHVALQLALSCSSRHYAGRSLQVFRALKVPLSSQMLSDILSRMVETVAEHCEDMQGYVTELMLTLEASVDNLDMDMPPIDFMKDLFMSTPNLSKEVKEARKSGTVVMRHNLPVHHFRSTSYTPSMLTRRMVTSAPPNPDRAEQRQHRMSMYEHESRKATNLSRSRSAQSLKQLTDPINTDDKLTILSQMFWLAVCVLESDYEHEFLLAVRLLDKILKQLQPDRPECKEKLEKIQQQLNWSSFPGVQALLLKGCTSPVTAEATWQLLSRLTQSIQAPVIDPTASIAFPMNVIALLPYLVEHYESPNKTCTEAAEFISQKCMEHSEKLDNLATVMTFYSRGTFAKDNFQWTKCVIKYLYDVYSHLSSPMVAFLVEVLEKGPSTSQLSVIQILHCILHYVDVTASPAKGINADLLRIVAKHVEHQHWKEALKILKLAVNRSSTLVAAPPIITTVGPDTSFMPLAAHTSFAEAEVTVRKELPGRTMDFTFDMKQAPIAGHKLVEPQLNGEISEKLKAEPGSDTVENTAANTSQMAENAASGWKRPQLSQARTRERLVNLLTSYGRGVGQLPKSPSESLVYSKVIFSQSSDTLERQASVCSSPEEASTTDAMTDDMRYDETSSTEQQLKVFDFLDKEMDDDDDESGDCVFNWGVKRHSVHEDEVTIKGRSTPASGRDESECSDDEFSARSESPTVSQDLVRVSVLSLPNQPVLDESPRHSSPNSSTHSINSVGTDLDTTDPSPDNESPVFSGMVYFGRVSLRGEEVEEAWRSHVHKVMGDNSSSQSVHTFYLFAKLFQLIQRRLHDFTREVCIVLSKYDGTRRIVLQLSDMLELLATEVECPMVYADYDMIGATRIGEKLKFTLLELNESHETYQMRKEQAFQSLENVRAIQKMDSLADPSSESLVDDQVIELCRCLYKLDLQVLLMYEGFINKLASLISAPPRAAQLNDFSKDVTVLRRELKQAALDMETGDYETLSVKLDQGSLSRQDAEGLLLECISSRQYPMALQVVRKLRSLFPAELFGGLIPSEDIEAVVLIYCRLQSENKPGVYAMSQTEHDQLDVCGRLREVNLLLSQSISQIEQQHKSEKALYRLSKASSASA